jgi:hypothetical protein
MTRTVSPFRYTPFVTLIVTALTLTACGGGGGSVSTPTSPTAPAPTTPPPTSGGSAATVAFAQDVSPILQADCARCHSGSRPDGNFSVTSYAAVMRAVVPGSANSTLVRQTRQGGAMYGNWSGNAAAKAETVRAWVVDNMAAESR